MEPEEVMSIILEILTAVLPDMDLGDIDPEIPLRDQLELESVDFLNIVMELQDRYGVEVPEEEYIELTTLNRCVAYLLPKLEKATL